MDRPTIPFRPEVLLNHREWVGRVARTLVYGGADAEDLQQQAWLEILQRPPEEEPQSARGWLRSVLRFKAIDALRAARTRRRHEEAAARPERVDASPDDILARAETMDRVVHAVFDLEEPLRTTVLLRYFEDLAPADIAARQGIPVETVRTRLKMAIARLRRRLDAENEGDRHRWCLALLAFLPRPSARSAATGGVTASAVAGGLLMGMKAKVTVAAVVLALLGTGVALRQTWQGTEPPAVPRLQADSGRPVSSSLDRGPQANRGEAPREEAGTRPIVATVQDRRGRPVPGVVLRLATGEEMLGSTGPDGKATLQVPAQGQGRILASAEGFAQASADFGPRTPAIDIRLDAGTKLVVLVVSEGGRPLGKMRLLGGPGDKVTTSWPGLTMPLPDPLGVTDDDGIAVIWRIPDANYAVMAADSHGNASVGQVRPSEGNLTLTFYECESVSGMVVDEEGRAVGGASVQAGFWGPLPFFHQQFCSPVHAEAGGRFSVPVPRSAVRVDFQALVAGEAWGHATLVRGDVADPWGEARIVLRRSTSVDIRLTLPKDVPVVAEVRVRWNYRANEEVVRETIAVPVEGRVHVGGLGASQGGADQRILVEVRAPAEGLVGRGSFVLPEKPGTVATVDVPLFRARELAGRVVGEDGQGVAGCLVTIALDPAVLTASTDVEGNFRILLAPENVSDEAVATVYGPGSGFLWKIGVPGDFLWRGTLRELTATGTLQVPGMVTVPGLLTLPDGSPCAGGSVYVKPWKPLLGTLSLFYDGNQGPPVVVSDESGRFRLAIRKEGEYSVVACAAGYAPTAVSSRAFAESGVLRLDPGCVLRGVVKSDAGEAIPFAKMTVYLKEDSTFMFLQNASGTGQYAFVGLPTGGEFFLYAIAKGLEGEGVLVRTEGAETRADITLRKVGILSLKVLTTDGVACSRGGVSYQGIGGGTGGAESLDGRGGCTISGQVQEYRLKIVPFLFREKGVGGVQFVPKETFVRPERGVVEEVRVEPAPAIRGKVVGAHGSPVAGAEVKLRMTVDLSLREFDRSFSFADNLGYCCLTDESGVFSLGVPKTGTYLADITAKGCLDLQGTPLATGSECEITLRPKE